MTDNELIAKFMGYDVKDGFVYSSNTKITTADALGYEIYWSKLFNVINTIEEIQEPCDLNPENGTYYPYFIRRCKTHIEVMNEDSVIFIIEGTNIKCFYIAVVEFIKWYNQQNQ